MKNFDRLLEFQLARLLDPIVKESHPPRRRRKRPEALVRLRAVAGGFGELPSDIVSLAEPVPLAPVPLAVALPTTVVTPAS